MFIKHRIRKNRKTGMWIMHCPATCRIVLLSNIREWGATSHQILIGALREHHVSRP